MNDVERRKLIKASWELHGLVEASYLANLATKVDEEWLDKQPVLLAGLALHLLQATIKPRDI